MKKILTIVLLMAAGVAAMANEPFGTAGNTAFDQQLQQMKLDSYNQSASLLGFETSDNLYANPFDVNSSNDFNSILKKRRKKQNKTLLWIGLGGMAAGLATIVPCVIGVVNNNKEKDKLNEFGFSFSPSQEELDAINKKNVGYFVGIGTGALLFVAGGTLVSIYTIKSIVNKARHHSERYDLNGFGTQTLCEKTTNTDATLSLNFGGTSAGLSLQW